MTDKIARRGFLKTGGLAVGSALLMGCQQQETKPAAGDSRRRPSTEFAAKNPRLLPGCCAYSFHTYFAKGEITYSEFLDNVVEMGSVGADMTVYWFKSTDPSYLTNLRHLAFRNGIPLSGAACGASMARLKHQNAVRSWLKSRSGSMLRTAWAPRTCESLAGLFRMV